MSISMYQVSVPVFLHGLGTLTHILRKGEEHASETGADPASYINARLAPDRFAAALSGSSDYRLQVDRPTTE